MLFQIKKIKYIKRVWTEKFGMRGRKIVNWEKTKNIFLFIWKMHIFQKKSSKLLAKNEVLN
jgi:hypothetical protein